MTEDLTLIFDFLGKYGVPLTVTGLLIIFAVKYIPKYMDMIITSRKESLKADIEAKADERRQEKSRQESYDKQSQLMISAIERSNAVIERSNIVMERNTIAFDQISQTIQETRKITEQVTKHIDENSLSLKEVKSELADTVRETDKKFTDILIAVSK